MTPRVIHILLCALGMVLAGCAPKLRVTAAAGMTSFERVALLPSVTTGAVSRERLAYFDRSLHAAMRSRGYKVLDSAIIRCADAGCSNVADIAREFGISQFLRLEVDTASEHNFLAGYVNSASGTLRGISADGSETFAIDHTTSETGGVVFYSGQVIQGIISQIENSNRDPFQQVAEKFVEQLVGSLPASQVRTPAVEEVAPEIASVNAVEIAPSTYEVCVKGSPGHHATLRLPNTKASLIEYRAGDYCGAFIVPASMATSTHVELRSPFGSTSRRTIELRDETPCEVARHARGSQDPSGRIRLRFGCDTQIVRPCALPKDCPELKFHLFAADEPRSPFRRVAVVNGTEWHGPRRTDGALYEVVPVGPLGPMSAPIRVSWAEDDK